MEVLVKIDQGQMRCIDKALQPENFRPKDGIKVDVEVMGKRHQGNASRRGTALSLFEKPEQ